MTRAASNQLLTLARLVDMLTSRQLAESAFYAHRLSELEDRLARLDGGHASTSAQRVAADEISTFIGSLGMRAVRRPAGYRIEPSPNGVGEG